MCFLLALFYPAQPVFPPDRAGIFSKEFFNIQPVVLLSAVPLLLGEGRAAVSSLKSLVSSQDQYKNANLSVLYKG